ncbi:hypothetical protein CEXT_87191 [Caerostris extrusa]|uniref:Uncharacterized protein n=1 Tax=Caerostris extrusa TaxID=172846 RepID=A0AAV4T9U4_CAEEX|nr:hypothetical protein CEXT_87191 [Caerostris extrusa]
MAILFCSPASTSLTDKSYYKDNNFVSEASRKLSEEDLRGLVNILYSTRRREKRSSLELFSSPIPTCGTKGNYPPAFSRRATPAFSQGRGKVTGDGRAGGLSSSSQEAASFAGHDGFIFRIQGGGGGDRRTSSRQWFGIVPSGQVFEPSGGLFWKATRKERGRKRNKKNE